MRNIFARSGKIALFSVMTMLLALPSFGQLSLRRALDTDGDGKADFTIFRPSTNIWYTNKSSGGQTFTNFGIASQDFMTPGDYDGDGKGDVSVWRDTNGTFYRLNSSDQTFVGVQFGQTGDEPVARDYDGDGKTDVAVFRNGTWYLQRSQSGFTGVNFGISDDLPTPNAFVR